MTYRPWSGMRRRPTRIQAITVQGRLSLRAVARRMRNCLTENRANPVLGRGISFSDDFENGMGN